MMENCILLIILMYETFHFRFLHIPVPQRACIAVKEDIVAVNIAQSMQLLETAPKSNIITIIKTIIRAITGYTISLFMSSNDLKG